MISPPAIKKPKSTPSSKPPASSSPPPPASFSTDPDRLVRAYTAWPTRNTFCCYGHCMTGPKEDNGPNLCAWGTILVFIALFFYVWGVTLISTSMPMLLFLSCAFASTIFWLLATSFTDPGILPRNTRAASFIDQMPPLYRNRIEDGRTVTDTWCTTCLIYRPPRASHCPDCDNCVRDFDHHCPFTRNCIGARNYPFFILFLVSVSVSLGGLLLSCITLASSNPSVVDHTSSPYLWRLNGFINLSLTGVGALLGLMLWGFTAYHLSLLITGFTTKESIKGRRNGAKSIALTERIGCCSPSELEPRRLIPDPSQQIRKGDIPTIQASDL